MVILGPGVVIVGDLKYVSLEIHSKYNGRGGLAFVFGPGVSSSTGMLAADLTSREMVVLPFRSHESYDRSERLTFRELVSLSGPDWLAELITLGEGAAVL